MVEYDSGYLACLEALRARLREPAPGRVQIVEGPRQVGKTTLLLAICAEHGDGARYVAADAPETRLPGFWERLWRDSEAWAGSRGHAVLCIDEVQHADDWARRIKAACDSLRRRRVPLHLVLTGSSALHLGAGGRESLAGRFERLVLSHWTARALATVFGIEPDAAADAVVCWGGYPGAWHLRHDVARWAAYVADAIVEPAIGRDILALVQVRRPALLRQLFVLAADAPAQIVALQKLQGQLQDRGALDTIASYLGLLGQAHLVATLDRFAPSAMRQRMAPPKLVPLNNAMVAVLQWRHLPHIRERDPARFGRWVENACLAFAHNAGQAVTYWREGELEVDAVITGSWGQWALEVKTGAFTATDLAGLLRFVAQHPTYTPLVACEDAASVAHARAMGIAACTWRAFLYAGPAAAHGRGHPARPRS